MTKTLTRAAQAAAFIRMELKNKFPSIKFSVKSENYSGGDSVRVHYFNGVPTKEVEAVIGKYQYGHFNGMEDIYEYSNSNDDLPQTKYLFVDRTVTQENKQIVIDRIVKEYGLPDFSDKVVFEKFNMWPDQKIWKEVSDITFA